MAGVSTTEQLLEVQCVSGPVLLPIYVERGSGALTQTFCSSPACFC